MSVASHYAGDAGERYLAYQQQAGRGRARAVARRLQRHIGASDAVLDFGCGPGWILDELRAAEKVGVEVNPAAASVAASLGLEVHDRTEALDDRRFDVVISNHALEHTLDPYRELTGLLRVLKPGGRLLLRLPINDWRNERRIDLDDPNHHLFTWTPLLIGNLLSEAGFDVDHASIINFRHPGRFSSFLSRTLPSRAYDAVCALTAVVRRRREVEAIATRPVSDAAG